MTDWIDDMKAKDDAAKRLAEQETALRLHRAEVIRAKAPAFWEALMENLKTYCTRLNVTFSDDLTKQCEFSRPEQNWVMLQGNTRERKTLRLRLNLYGLGIDQEFFSGFDQRSKSAGMLSFDLDKNELLFLRSEYATLSSPEALSESLIKKVIAS